MNKEPEKQQDLVRELQIDKQELDALSARVAERRLADEDWQRLHRYLVLLSKLTNVLESGRVRIRKLTRILFGKRTEKDRPEADKTGKDKNKPTLSKREANATPIEFRDELLKLALHSAT